MNTKAIYMPNGKAGEYAKYACNYSKVDRVKFEEKNKDIFVDKNYNIFQ